MTRWLTLTSAATVAFLVLAVPAQAGPLPGLVPMPPIPDDLPSGGGDAQGLANEIRGEVQSLVNDHVGNHGGGALKSVLEYAATLSERVKETPHCLKVEVKVSPGAEPTEPETTSGESGGSHWTTISTGNVMLKILVKDCIGNISHPQSAPDP